MTRSGSFARYVSAPESAVYGIGELPFAEAALLEPLACVAWGLKQVQPQAVAGLGLLATQLLAASSHARAPQLLEKPLSHAEEAVRVAAFNGLRELRGDADLRPLDLANAVDAALDSIKPVADAKGVRVVAAHQARPATMEGDPERLQQIVANLLTNAVKFTPRGGAVTVGGKALVKRGPGPAGKQAMSLMRRSTGRR